MNKNGESWIRLLQWTALLVFLSVPFFVLMVPQLAGRVVWTIVVAALPLFIVLIGYHRWRRICPLAFFSQFSGRFGWNGKRKASAFLETNYHYVALSIFVISLWIRLIATNGSGAAIAIFFIVIAVAALIVGMIYTGKTWCNFICPLSFIEKIYTEPNGLRETSNSQCMKCTACKKSCPDISEENGYWKEIQTQPKKFAYFTFPGLVFGFYFYYFLQSGTWDYYFGGSWTFQPDVVYTAFLPGWNEKTAGFFFFHSIPRAAASLLTLVVFGAMSYWFFCKLERLIARIIQRGKVAEDSIRVRHILFSLASFTAFVVFYSFAGAPTLRKISPAPHFFLILVVLTATIFLYRRLSRSQQTFAEESVARNILKRWQWPDDQPRDLREAFVIHTIRKKELARGSARVLAVYEDAIRQTIAESFVTREDVQKLHSLRATLQIRDEDHDVIMEKLAEEQRASITDPTKHVSSEKRYQLEGYENALQKYLETAFNSQTVVEDPLVIKLRTEFMVTKEEHLAILDRLMGGTKNLASQLSNTIVDIEKLAITIYKLKNEPSPLHNFLKDLIRRRLSRSANALLKGLSFAIDQLELHEIVDLLCSENRKAREIAIERICAFLPAPLPQKLICAFQETSKFLHSGLNDLLKERLAGVDPYIRAVALYALALKQEVNLETVNRMLSDEHHFVSHTAVFIKQKMTEGDVDQVHAIERMITLKTLPLFDQLSPQALAKLAQSCRFAEYQAGDTLCSQGEDGDEVFVVLSGKVNIFKGFGKEEKNVASLGVGDLIGEIAIFDPAPRSATAIVANCGAQILSLDGENFRQIIDSDPSFSFHILETLARRLRMTSTSDQQHHISISNPS